MRRLLQLTVVVLLLLLPSQAVCMMCPPDRCPMQADPEPVEVTEPAGCHQMGGHGATAPAAVARASLTPDCCAVAAEPEDEAPALLTPAPASPVLAEAPAGLESSFDGDAPVPPSSAPPALHPPLYHLHSSLLI